MLGAILGLVGGIAQASAAKKAANAQSAAAGEQLALQREMFDYQKDLFAPFQESSENALAAYMGNLGLADMPEGVAAYGAETDPNYNFALNEGQRAIEGSAAMNGGLYSGRTLEALQSHGQDTAMTYRDNYLNRLAGAATPQGAGLAATAASNYATGAGQAYGNIGNAQSAGAIGVGNAWNSGINNALGAFSYQQALNGGTSPTMFSYDSPSWFTGGQGW